MKIAVTSFGDGLDSGVDPRFGRAVNLVLIDTETSEVTAVSNSQNANALQGAGIQASKTVSELGVEYLITGHCGPKAFRALSAASIKVIVGAEGTVEEVVAKFKAGELVVSDGADVEGHWV